MTRIKNVVDQALDMSRRARMERAREMGFSTPEFRGTKGDQVEFYTADRGKTRGTGIWTSDSPATASSYAPNIEEGAVYPLLTDTSRHARINASGANWNSIETEGLTAKLPSGEEVLVSDLFPEEIEPGTMTSTDELAQLFRQRGMEDGVVFERVVDVGPNFGSYKYAEEYLRDKGYNFQFPLGDPRVPQEDQIAAMRYAETREPGVANTTVHFRPQNIRSVNAAFDPAKRDSSNLLAGVGGAAVGAGILGAGVAPQEAEAAPFGTLARQLGRRTREAWHGSPHVYDQVDLSRMGTGEGAQAYGAGYYAADARSVAESYRAPSTEGGILFDGERMAGTGWMSRAREANLSPEEQGALLFLQDERSLSDALESARLRADVEPELEPSINRLVERGLVTYEPPRQGPLYRLEIPDEDLLDWDAPLSEQPEGVRTAVQGLRDRRQRLQSQYEDLREANVQAAMSRDTDALERTAAEANAVQRELDALPELPGENARGSELYAALSRNNPRAGSQPPGATQASRVLSEAGIPGIRYLDGVSRNAGEGTRNYVIFDDRNVNVVERNGEPIAAMPRGREEPMSAAAGFARPGAMAATGAAGALASFLNMRSGKQDTPYKRFIAEGQRAVEQAIGAGENIGNLAASILVEPIAGYAGLVAGPEAVERVRDYFAPQSMSPAAQQQMIGLGNTLESAGQQIMSGLDVAGQAVGVDRLSDYARYAPGYWEQRVVPALQRQFGTRAGSALAATLRAAPEAL